MKQLKGVIPVLPTPFTTDSSVDYASLGRLIEHLVTCGVDGLTMFGIASEFYKLDDREREEMTRFFVNAAGGRVPTVVSVTRHATDLAVRDAQWAQEQGVDALMLLPPFFANPSEQAIVNHMQRVMAAVDIPVILQYAPETGVTISTHRFLSLLETADKPFVIKVEVSPPGAMISTLVEKGHGRIRTLVGNGGRFLFDALLRGAVGVMPGCSVVNLYVELLKRFQAGDRDEAFRIYNTLMPYLDIAGLAAERFIYYEKHLLHQQGIFSSPATREPRYEPDRTELELFERYQITLAELGYTA